MAINDVIVSQGRVGIGDTSKLSTLTVRAKASFTLSGTVAKTAASSTLTGTATTFLSEVGLGDRITIPGGASETRTVVAVATDTSLTVDSDFENTASGQSATLLPSAARFTASDGDNPVTVSDQGYVGIGTLVPRLGSDGGALLRVHAPESGPWMLALTSDDVDPGPGGVGIWLQGRLLTFNIIDDAGFGPEVFHVGSGDEGGIRFLTGLAAHQRALDTNDTLTASDYTITVDAGSGGVTITLPPATGVGEIHHGRIYYVFKTAGSGSVTITPDGSDLINGANSSKTITTTWTGIRLFSIQDADAWIATSLSAA